MNYDSNYNLDFETIAIIVIVFALLWWLFSGSSKKIVTNVTTEPTSNNNDINSSVQPNETVVQQTDNQNHVQSEIIQPNVVQPVTIQHVLHSSDTSNYEMPLPVVAEQSGNNLVSQHATIQQHHLEGAVMHTATGEIINIKNNNAFSESSAPKPNDYTKVKHAPTQNENKIKKNLKVTLTDSAISSDSESNQAYPAPVNSFLSHASADHSVSGSEKKKKNKK